MCTIDEVLDEHLTLNQQQAAEDPADEVLCLACAGSGKSRTLAYRIARLLAEGADPEGIVAFTFTEKAADSIKRRVAEALRAADEDPRMLGAMYLDTIHGYCKQVLGKMDARYRQFEVLDDNRLVLYLVSRYPELGLHRIRDREDWKFFKTINEVKEAWKLVNDEMVDLQDVTDHDGLVGGVLRRLRTMLDDDEFIDFSLMIRLVVEGLEDGDAGALRAVADLEHLMVDEYQDVNPVQERLIASMHDHSDSLFVVGDDDQAIYAWRGADVNHILTFRDRYPDAEKHTISKNFRSVPAIVDAADGFAHRVLGPSREAKDPEADPCHGPEDFRVLWFDDRDAEAEWVADRIDALLGTAYEENGTTRGLTPGDFAILMRSTKGSEQDGTSRHTRFTRALREGDIRFTLEQGGGVFERPQVAALRETFELLRDGMVERSEAEDHFRATVRPAFPEANFQRMTKVLAHWGRQIHQPREDMRRRVLLQQFVHQLLNAFGVQQSNFDSGTLRDLGVFSKMIQDVEAVYVSIDSPDRYTSVLNFLSNSAESGYDSSVEEVVQRPDAVMVTTVHKAKGLEFPAVFVADVEHQRFPMNRSSYRGLVPDECIQDALDRGAYQSTREEEARVFYTAVTRAERYLHITGAERLPAAKGTRTPSPFVRNLQHDAISDDPDELPAGLEEAEPRRRIEETVVPTSFSQIRYYLRCPRDYQFRHRLGFSPQIAETFGYGLTVHAAVGKLHEVYRDRPPEGDEAEEVARQIFHLKHVPPSNDPENNPGPYERAQDSASEIVQRYATEYRDDFLRKRQVELPFEIPLRDAVISGEIDLVLRYDDEGNVVEATVVDFKAMEGGDEPDRSEDLEWSELALQVQLYALAATEVLGQVARTGAVHLLKDGQRVQVPIDDEAIAAAEANVEWAVQRIIDGDYPMRPHPEKCAACDFELICAQQSEEFDTDETPPPIHVPGGEPEMARAFGDFEGG